MFSSRSNQMQHPALRDLESVTLHTISVLFNHALAIFLWIIARAEKHTVVTGNLLVLAYTTWLDLLRGLGF